MPLEAFQAYIYSVYHQKAQGRLGQDNGCTALRLAVRDVGLGWVDTRPYLPKMPESVPEGIDKLTA